MSKKSIIFFIILVLCLAGASFTAYYFFSKYRAISSGQVVDPKEAENLKIQVSKLVILPDEEPVIATVTDKTKLEQQAFFRLAENGDKVLIFQKAQKAVLYRPSEKKLVDMTVLNTVAPSEATSATNPEPFLATIAILNGTSVAGLAGQLQQDILANELFKNASTVSVASAARSDYLQTIVVDVSKKYTSQAAAVAQFLNASIQDLPADQESPNADILVIVGADQL